MLRSLVMLLLYPAKIVESWLAYQLGKAQLALLSAAAFTSSQAADLSRAIGQNIAKAAWKKYSDHEYFFIEDAIELMERAWALSKVPESACRMGLMYERANRNHDALRIYREAFKLFPGHADLRYQASIELLRHGSYAEIREFLASVSNFDPDDEFTRFATDVLNCHEPWVAEISMAVQRCKSPAPVFLLSFAVWGEPYVSEFVRYTCSSLLAPGNLPALSGRYSVHFVILTTMESEKAMRVLPIFEHLTLYASFHFIYLDVNWLGHSQVMTECYGERLGHHYAANCKFLLFSGAHYATLEAGRRLGALVMPLGGDNVLNDGALARLADVMTGEVDAVVVTGFRLPRTAVVPEVEEKYRQPDGTLRISPAEYGDLLVKHIPENNFVDSREFTHFPLILCWRIGKDGVLVHSNHYLPCCIRAGAIMRPLMPTIDPTDGRFMQRHLPDIRRIHIVQDTSIVVSDWGDSPLIVNPGTRKISFDEVSLWLWMYWDSLRDPYFRTAIQVGRRSSPEAWEQAGKEADQLIGEILAESSRREAANLFVKHWRLR